jgi:hypothetical protein
VKLPRSMQVTLQRFTVGTAVAAPGRKATGFLGL